MVEGNWLSPGFLLRRSSERQGWKVRQAAETDLGEHKFTPRLPRTWYPEGPLCTVE